MPIITLKVWISKTVRDVSVSDKKTWRHLLTEQLKIKPARGMYFCSKSYKPNNRKSSRNWRTTLDDEIKSILQHYTRRRPTHSVRLIIPSSKESKGSSVNTNKRKVKDGNHANMNDPQQGPSCSRNGRSDSPTSGEGVNSDLRSHNVNQDTNENLGNANDDMYFDDYMNVASVQTNAEEIQEGLDREGLENEDILEISKTRFLEFRNDDLIRIRGELRKLIRTRRWKSVRRYASITCHFLQDVFLND